MAELKGLQPQLRAQTAPPQARYLAPAPISSTASLPAAPREPNRTTRLEVRGLPDLLRLRLVRAAQRRLRWALAAESFHRPRASTLSSLENPSRRSLPNLA